MSLSKVKLANRIAYRESLLRPVTATQRKAILPRPQPKGDMAYGLDYEASIPRCEICRHVQKEKTVLHKATLNCPVIIVPPVCMRGRFYTANAAICAHWEGRDGSTLVAASKTGRPLP